MRSKALVVLAALVPAGCSGPGAQSPPAGDALIFPPGVDVQLEPGGAGVLALYALTLQDGPDGLELYAALKNTGDVPACDAALKVTIYDRHNQALGNFINGLDTLHLYDYALPDGSSTIAACASPGDLTMTDIATLAADIQAADVGQVVYYYSYFALDAAPVDGLEVTGVTAAPTPSGTAYDGTVVNHLDMTVSDPSVRVFPLNRAGRPLGMASAGDSSQIAAGGSWTFQTGSIDVSAADYAAFPAASFSN